jgi:alcohol dehydrogenase (NADP+)
VGNGSQVVAISRKLSKRDDAISLGADLYIATEDEPSWAEVHARSLDIVLSTISSSNVRHYSPSFTRATKQTKRH